LSFSPSKTLSPLSHQLSMHGFQVSATSSMPSKPCTISPISRRSLLGLPPLNNVFRSDIVQFAGEHPVSLSHPPSLLRRRSGE